MFFEKEDLSFHILDILELKQKNVNMFNSERNFNAISFRYRADTILKTETSECHLKDHCVSYVPARLNYSRTSNIDELIVVHFDTTNYNTRNIEYFVPKDPSVLSNLFRSILDCWNEKELGYRYRCSALLCEIFAECYVQNFVSKPQHSKIQSSVEYLMANYKSSELSIQKLAEKSFMSEVYFRKLFKEEFGVSPQKYIVNLRIQHAVGLISAGYHSLKEVAQLSGYDDYKYFSVEFKKAMGVSPSDYLYNYKPE